MKRVPLLKVICTVALTTLGASSISNSQGAHLWWPPFPWNSQTDAHATVVHMYVGTAGYRNGVKITPFPANNFGCATNYGEFVIDDANPKLKQMWSQLTLAQALGLRVNVYPIGCSGGGTAGLPLVSDIVVRSAN